MRYAPVAVGVNLLATIDTDTLAEQLLDTLEYEEVVDFVRFLNSEAADSVFTDLLKEVVDDL